jgi:general secretion pathway protein K
MPTVSSENDVDGYKISSTIDDMQGRFNLNNLSDAGARDTFIRLLRIVDKKLTLQKAQSLTDAAQKWIDVQAPEDDELSQYYLHQARPYRSAHRLMANPSELSLVKGMTPELYKALQPFITALPVTTYINVQTAPAEVLAALSPAMTVDIGETVIKLRKEQPFNSEGEFKDLAIIRDKEIKENLTVKSTYFLVETKVATDAQKLVLYTLLERDSKEGKVRIMWQSKGIW